MEVWILGKKQHNRCDWLLYYVIEIKRPDASEKSSHLALVSQKRSGWEMSTLPSHPILSTTMV